MRVLTQLSLSPARIIWSWHSNSLSCLNDCLLRVDTAKGLILKKPMLFCCRLMWSILLSSASLHRKAIHREKKEREARKVDIQAVIAEGEGAK